MLQKLFFFRFCIRGLIPHVERQMRLFNDIVTNRKSRSLFSGAKRWFGQVNFISFENTVGISDLGKSINYTHHLQHIKEEKASGWSTQRGGSPESKETEIKSFKKIITFLLMPVIKICKTYNYSHLLDHNTSLIICFECSFWFAPNK